MAFPCVTSIQLDRHLKAEQDQEAYEDACNAIVDEMFDWSAQEAFGTLFGTLPIHQCEQLQDLLSSYAMIELGRREANRKRDEDGQ